MLPMGDEEKKIFEQFNSDLKQYRNLRENVIKLIDAKNYCGARNNIRICPKVTDIMFDTLDKLIETNLNESKVANDNISSIYATSTTIMTYIKYYWSYIGNYNRINIIKVI